MAPVRRFGPGWHARPLLGCTRDEIAAEAAALGLVWVEDPSNQDTRLDRNYLRQIVLPALVSRWPRALGGIRERIGTGHGERERSDVVMVDFRRARPQPDDVRSIRYDSYANLVARGVIPGAPRVSEPNPFPGMRFVPDPRS